MFVILSVVDVCDIPKKEQNLASKLIILLNIEYFNQLLVIFRLFRAHDPTKINILDLSFERATFI